MKGKGLQVFANKSKELMENIECYLTQVTSASLHFDEAMKDYIAGRMDQFEERIRIVTTIEREADADIAAGRVHSFDTEGG